MKLMSSRWSYDKTIGTGDFNGDRFNDLLGRDSSGALWLIPGTRSGGLGARVRIDGSWDAFDVITGYGDYNHDGRPDLFARSARSGKGYVFPNVGGNKLGHWFGPIRSTKGVAALSSGGNVVDGGPADLVGRKGDALVVLAHSGTWNTSAPMRVNLGFGNADTLLNVGDWDRDGDGDLIVRARSGRLNLRLSNGHGTFGSRRVIGTGFDRVGLLSAVGDMTGDGYPDLMGQPFGGAMRIYPGRGAAGLGASYVAYGAISAERQYGVGLWDGDGSPDSMLRVADQLVLYPGNGPGGLTGPEPLGVDVSSYDWVLGVGDIKGSGHADLIVRSKRTGYLWLLPGKASGFRHRVFLAAGLRPLQPGRLIAEDLRRALVVVLPLPRARIRVPDPDRRPAPHERLGERREPVRRDGIGCGEQAATGPDGAVVREQLGLGPTKGREVIGGGRVPRDERVRLRPDLDAEVVDAGGERFGEPHAQRAQGAGDRGGMVLPAPDPVRPTDRDVWLRVESRDQADVPGGAEEHRAEPMAGQVDVDRPSTFGVELLDQQ